MKNYIMRSEEPNLGRTRSRTELTTLVFDHLGTRHCCGEKICDHAIPHSEASVVHIAQPQQYVGSVLPSWTRTRWDVMSTEGASLGGEQRGVIRFLEAGL